MWIYKLNMWIMWIYIYIYIYLWRKSKTILRFSKLRFWKRVISCYIYKLNEIQKKLFKQKSYLFFGPQNQKSTEIFNE